MKRAWTFEQRIASIGLFGGLFWGAVHYVLFLFNFTKVGPSFVLLPWALPEWKHTYVGHLLGIVFISILSLGIAFLYRWLLKRWETIWVGALFGGMLWFFIFFILHPIFPSLESVPDMEKTTLITTLCLFVMYGVFIGYSVAYEYKEVQHMNQ